MELTERKLEDLSQLHYRFYTCPFFEHPSSKALVVAFEGEYGYGAKGNDDAIFMAAIIKAGLEAWGHSALIIDLRMMSYVWGDMIGQALTAGHGRYINAVFPTGVIVSDRNREGLTSFVRQELDEDPAKWLFESLADALRAVEERDPAVRKS